jgi:hypothetical protein
VTRCGEFTPRKHTIGSVLISDHSYNGNDGAHPRRDTDTYGGPPHRGVPMPVPSPAVLDVPAVDLTPYVAGGSPDERAGRERDRVVRAASLEASR